MQALSHSSPTPAMLRAGNVPIRFRSWMPFSGHNGQTQSPVDSMCSILTLWCKTPAAPAIYMHDHSRASQGPPRVGGGRFDVRRGRSGAWETLIPICAILFVMLALTVHNSVCRRGRPRVDPLLSHSQSLPRGCCRMLQAICQPLLRCAIVPLNQCRNQAPDVKSGNGNGRNAIRFNPL